jgi:hypothetical protein
MLTAGMGVFATVYKAKQQNRWGPIEPTGVQNDVFCSNFWVG